METSGIEDSAMRLLGAFYDLSGGNFRTSVAVGASGTTRGGAAAEAGMDPDSTEPEVAVRYLVNQGYLKPDAAGSAYNITIPGIERVRQTRGLAEPAASGGRSGMSDKTQRRLVTLLSTAIGLGLSQPLTNYIGEQIPERRGIRDDVLEAALQGLVRAVSIMLASLLVRQLAGRL